MVEQKDVVIALFGAGATIASFSLIAAGILATFYATAKQSRRALLWAAGGATLIFGLSMVSVLISSFWLVTRVGVTPGRNPGLDFQANVTYAVVVLSFQAVMLAFILVSVWIGYLTVLDIWDEIVAAWQRLREKR
jgi:hypothetical protein